jgi:subtilisin family serine protease
LNQSTVAVLDQSTVAVLDGSKYAAFGHGTMVAGLVHLVAPTAKIMPLKSFHSDGSAYSSDVLRAIYYAVDHHADVINMSWNFTAPSKELGVAIDYATGKGVVCVAAAGNSGQKAIVYPAAYKNVIDVGSTTNQDKPSTFSNYGAPPLLLAAPGEAVVTTYPFNTYAAGWGTSFSAPLVAGGTALMLSATPARSSLLGNVMNLVPGSAITTVQASGALSHAEWISAPQLGKGRLDVYQAVRAWRQNLGLE